MNPQLILIADDDAAIAAMLEHLLSQDGHFVATALDGRDALKLFRSHQPDLVLTDLDMPYVSGFEVCRAVKAEAPLVPVAIITGRDDQQSKLKAWDLNADDFLTKPFQPIEVLARCRSLLKTKRLLDDLDSAEQVVFAFARAVEAKCQFTWGHSTRVSEYALMIARDLGLSAEDLTLLRKGCLLHDIGKISIPDSILNKPDSLTMAEFEIVRQHPLQGVHILEPLHSIRNVIPLVRWHHERLDGRGYPDGLFGGAIPLLTRILSVADVFDALASDRPYRSAMPVSKCFELLRHNAAHGGLDPEFVNQFCRLQAASLQSVATSSAETEMCGDL